MGNIKIVMDPVETLLNEIAFLAGVWQNCRASGHTPEVTRGALMEASRRLLLLEEVGSQASHVRADQLNSIAKRIHYPACWDTAAYPTLLDAIREMAGPCTCDECPERKEPMAGVDIDRIHQVVKSKEAK